MNYLITGGTGFIGSKLVENLLENGHRVTILSRKNSTNSQVKTIHNLAEISENEKIDYVVNLAGEPIAAKRWSKKQKEILLNSRLKITKEIIELIAKLNDKPQALISASAVGFYGSNDDRELNETSPHQEEFTHQLCKSWEEQAFNANKFGLRTCITRFGIVLGKNGGALKKMSTAFQLGLGGKIGNGQQFMSWIHLDDAVAAINFLINHQNLSGVFNLTAPHPVKNSQFTQILAKTLHRPAFFDMPNLAVKILFGEMGETLLVNGQNVVPKNLLDAGFQFKFEKLENALADIYYAKPQ